MASSLFDSCRGSLPLLLRDATDPSTVVGRSTFSLSQPVPLAIGEGPAPKRHRGLCRDEAHAGLPNQL